MAYIIQESFLTKKRVARPGRVKVLMDVMYIPNYVFSSYLLKFAVHAAKKGKQKVRPLKWLLSLLFQTFLSSSSGDMQPPHSAYG